MVVDTADAVIWLSNKTSSSIPRLGTSSDGVRSTMLYQNGPKHKRKFALRTYIHMIVDFSIAILILVRVTYFNTDSPEYIQSCRNTWQKLLVAPQKVSESVDPQQFYKVHNLQAALNNTAKAYFTLHETSVDILDQAVDEFGIVKPIELYVARYESQKSRSLLWKALGLQKTSTEIFLMNMPDPLSGTPFMTDKFRKSFETFECASMKMIVNTRNMNSYFRIIHKWEIFVDFIPNSGGGRFDSEIRSYLEFLSADASNTYTILLLLIESAIVTCCLIGTLSSIIEYRIYCIEKSSRRPGVNSLQLVMVHRWFAPVFLSYVFSSIGAFLNIVDVSQYGVVATSEAYLEAIGSMFSFLILIRYLEYWPESVSLFVTVQKGLPEIAIFMTAVFPIFVGYSMFGLIIFCNQGEMFTTFTASMESLFAAAGGDEIRNMLVETGPSGMFASRIMIYSFVMLFLSVVTKIVLSIVKESFFSSAYHNSMKTGETKKSDDTERTEVEKELEFRNDLPLAVKQAIARAHAQYMAEVEKCVLESIMERRSNAGSRRASQQSRADGGHRGSTISDTQDKD